DPVLAQYRQAERHRGPADVDGLAFGDTDDRDRVWVAPRLRDAPAYRGEVRVYLMAAIHAKRTPSGTRRCDGSSGRSRVQMPRTWTLPRRTPAASSWSRLTAARSSRKRPPWRGRVCEASTCPATSFLTSWQRPQMRGPPPAIGSSGREPYSVPSACPARPAIPARLPRHPGGASASARRAGS